MTFYTSVIIVLLLDILIYEKCIGAEKIENSTFDPDINRNVTELISTKGYPVEEYDVITPDGFILSMQRIPHGIYQQKLRKCKREVVFLMHGLGADSSSWVQNFPNQSLGFILADNGYDVWLGNTRANTYSRRHIKLTPAMKEFWDFSFDEYAAHDIPAMIDFILNQTKVDQLIYIGHSQGTTSMFALLSHKPEYIQKIKLFIAMAPVTTGQHMTSSLLLFLAPFAENTAVKFMFTFLGIYDLKIDCNLTPRFCNYALMELNGNAGQRLNKTRLPVYSAHFLRSSSMRNYQHFVQTMSSKKFQKFDFGVDENLRHYDQTTPPVYDITKITTPVVLMWSTNDKISDPRDVHELENLLPNIILSYCIPYEDFGHIDFVIAIDAYELVYQKILTLLCNFSH